MFRSIAIALQLLILLAVVPLVAAVSVSVSPSTVTVKQKATQTFTATVTGSTNTAVTWTVTAGGGSITTAGVYTAPTLAGTYTVTATSKADVTAKATATVTVPSVAISVSPTSATVPQSATQQFTATVTGSTTTTVTWSVSTGGGTITTAGLYTAPKAAGTYTVTAKSNADTTKTATATVTVPSVAISISPTTATVNQGASQQFVATVTGAKTTTATWTVSTGGGTVSTSGLYKAPAVAGTYTVTATSTADTTKTASATVTVPTVGISLSPASATVNQGATKQFTGTVTGSTNTGITWTVTSGGGTVSTSGLYTAPVKKPGTYTITATSKADTSKSATATVVVPAVAVTVNPGTAIVSVGASQQFTATVTGAADATVTWSVSTGGGSIDTTGLYTAPLTSGTFTVTATSFVDNTKKATAQVVVGSNVSITVSPNPATVPINGTLQFAATVLGSSNTAVSWSLSGAGTISASGLYTAPGSLASSTVIATAQADVSKQALVPVTITPTPVVVTPKVAVLAPGASQVFTSNQTADWSTSRGTILDAGTSATYTASVGGTNLDVGTYTVTAGSPWDSALDGTAYIQVQVPGSPLISAFTATPSSIHAGQTTTLSWEVSNATELFLDPGYVRITGTSLTVAPISDTTYRLWASNTLGRVWMEVLVKADLTPAITSFTATPAVVNLGSNVQLGATFSNGSGQIDNGVGAILSGGILSAVPIGWTDFTLTVTNPYGGAVKAKAPVSVLDPYAQVSSAPSLLPSAKYNHTATVLADGRVLLVGGTGSFSTISAESGTALLFDPATGNSIATGSLASPRYGHSATLLADGKVLVFGGRIDAYTVPGGEIYNPATGTFSALGYMNRIDHSATLLPNGEVLIAGGLLTPFNTRMDIPCQAVFERTNRCLIFNPSDGSLRPTGAMNRILGRNYTLQLPDGKVLVAGYEGLELFDPETENFVLLSTDPAGPLGLLPDGKVRVGSRVFNLATGHFDASPACPADADALDAPLADGRALLWRSQNSTLLLAGGPANATREVSIGLANVSPNLGTATRLQDGRVLLAGGYNSNTKPPALLDPGLPLGIRPVTGRVRGGEPLAFTATGTDSTLPLAWNASGGTIDATGHWVAPTAPGMYAIKVEPVADPSRCVQATIMVVPSMVTIQGPRTVSVAKGASVVFSATVLSQVQTVYWSLAEGAVAGTVDASGKYTAGSTAGSFTLVATSAVDASQQDRIVITVLPDTKPAILSFVADRQVAAAGLDPVNLSWVIQGDPDSVTLTTGETITPVVKQGTHTIWPTPGYSDSPYGPYVSTYYKSISLMANSTRGNVSATVRIRLVDPRAVRILPRGVSVLPGESVQLSAFFDASGVPAPNVDWTALDGGSITAQGLFIPPSTSGSSYRVQVTNRDLPLLTDTIRINVVAAGAAGPPVVAFASVRKPILRSGSTELTWTATDAQQLLLQSSLGEQWDVTNLTSNPGDSSAQFIVTPSETATYTLLASNDQGTAASVTTIYVGDGISLAPTTVNLRPGETFLFSFNGGTGLASSADLLFTATGGTGTISGSPMGNVDYTAPTTPGTYQVTLSRKDKPALQSTAQVVVASGTLSSKYELLPSVQSVSSGRRLRLPSVVSGATWSASGGTVDIFGLFTPPSTPGSYQVTGTTTSTWPSSKSTVTVLVDSGTAPALSISPSTATVLPGGTVKFSFQTSGRQVSWTASGGTILSDGTYTAPATLGTYQITVSSPDGVSAAATVNVVSGSAPPAGIRNIFPSHVLLRTGQTIQFSTDPFTTGTLTWSLQGDGLLTPDGTYTAPQTEGAAMVTAEWTNGQGYFNRVNASVLFKADPVPQLIPTEVVLGPGQTFQFQAKTGGRPVAWIGNVTSSGLYTAPTTPGSYLVSLQDLEFAAHCAVATVQVRQLTISPTHLSVAPGTSLKFQALCSIAGATPVWTCSAGTVAQDGTYTAPAAVGTATVTVTVPSGGGGPPLATDTAQVEVRADIATIVSFAVDKTFLKYGEKATLNWSTLNAQNVAISGLGTQPATGSQQVTPSETTTYTLTANNLGGGAAASLKVKVQSELRWSSDRIYGFGQLLCEDRRQPDGSTQTLYLQTDQVGSPNYLTNDAGQVVGRNKNLPFGERFSADGAQSFERFAGHEDDGAIPIYMQARVNVPAYGRFAQPDPAYDKGALGSTSLFAYTMNTPLTHNDLNGENAKFAIDEKNKILTVSVPILFSRWQYQANLPIDNTMVNRIVENLNRNWDNSGHGWDVSYEKPLPGINIFRKTQPENWHVDIKAIGYLDRLPIIENTEIMRKNINRVQVMKPKENDRADVADSKGGLWKEDDPVSSRHEFGHLLFFENKYWETTQKSFPGFFGRVMSAEMGDVTTKDIEELVKHVLGNFKIINNGWITKESLTAAGDKGDW